MFNFAKNNWHLLAYFVFSVFSIMPLLSPGFFPMHDDTQVSRVFEMAKSLSHGMFPVRWVEDLGYGYGYPVFNFYSPLPYYIGGLLTFLGINALDSTKIIFILVTIGSGISMFFLVRELFGKLPALVSAVMYLYFPYHAVNIYIRGALAELSAYAFLPLVFLSLFKISKEKYHKGYLLLGVMSLSVVILSHNLTAFILLLFLGIFIVFSLILNENRLNKIYSYGLVFLLAFLLTSFYAIPAIYESQYANIGSVLRGGSNPIDHFVCVNQLWDSPWGFGGSAPGCLDGMSFKLGKISIFLVIAALFFFISNFKKLKDKFGTVLFLFIALALSIFMVLEYSRFFWNLPFMEFLQFPWRFLNLVGLFMAAIVGYLIWQVGKMNKKVSYTLVLVVILLTLGFNIRLFEPKTIHDRKSSFYTDLEYIKGTVSKISDEYLPRDFKRESENKIVRSSFDIVSGNGSLIVEVDKTGENKAKVNLSESSTVRANIAYFPAWKLYVDGRESTYTIKENGLYFNLNKGEHELLIKFVQTPLEQFANSLTIIGLLGIIIVIIPYGKKTS